MPKNKQLNPSTSRTRRRPVYKHPIFIATIAIFVLAGAVFAIVHFAKNPAVSPSNPKASTSQSSDKPNSTRLLPSPKKNQPKKPPPRTLLPTLPFPQTAKLPSNMTAPTQTKTLRSLATLPQLASVATNSLSASTSTNISPLAPAPSLFLTALTNLTKQPVLFLPPPRQLVKASTFPSPNSQASLALST